MADCPALIVGLTPSSTLNKETDALLVPVACSAVGPAAPSKLASLWKFPAKSTGIKCCKNRADPCNYGENVLLLES